jgi:hypothetical protein
MANLKSIVDVPVAESAEGLNLIVEDNGVAKKIAASEVGAQADWNEEDTTSPAYILNKPEISTGGGGGAYVYNASGHPTVNVLEIEFDSSLSDQENSDLFYERMCSGLVILKWESGLITPVLCQNGSTVYLYHPQNGSVTDFYSNLLSPSTI